MFVLMYGGVPLLDPSILWPNDMQPGQLRPNWKQSSRAYKIKHTVRRILIIEAPLLDKNCCRELSCMGWVDWMQGAEHR